MSRRNWSGSQPASAHLQRLALGLRLNLNVLQQSRPRIVVVAVASCVCFVFLKGILWGRDVQRLYAWNPRPESTSPGQKNVVLDPSAYLNGPPTPSFRDNLKPGVKYVTTWNRGGLTNEFITWINLIHLAYVSQRIPVLPPLLPDEQHLGKGGTSLDASDIFDMPRLAKTLKLPILEWRQLKRARYYKSYIPADQEPHDDDEVLGCWSTYPATSEDHDPSNALTPHFLHLNVQYTAAPANISTPSDSSPFSGLAQMLSPPGRVAALSVPPPTWAEEPISPAPEPDDQLACFDDLYAPPGGEWEKDLGATWDLVGTNMRFTRRMDLLATSLLRRIFDLKQFDVVPPFISVHIRRGDLDYFCGSPNRWGECLPPLSAYAERVREIQDELRRTRGQDSIYGDVAEVIVTSDETNLTWWAEVEEMGWKETKTLKQELQMNYGIWFPPVIDAVILSNGAGFVGTSNSTMSVIAAKRVLDWQGGPSRMVHW
ncbi:hypothetical protein M407DRAFT_33068 [Tulasnella calospora MUT 4182]|uniref:Uncharacterized protein n=1 Tax=Tulasnella calospora MUT 4182 TaxID=1051891 RepID=A0A0C3K791_9AGAM|nr:hypothetical protein M407DRAFT_33068 [Tulasnella calospora MUT 4182]